MMQMKLSLPLMLAILAAPLAAQVESPVPFDSAGQMMVITPSTAQRMRLAPPAWPVVGDFREARVFIAGAERFVLVVERPDGARERFPMSATEYESLRVAVSRSSAGVAPAAPPKRAEAGPRMGAEPRRAPARGGGSAVDEDGETSRTSFTARMMTSAALIYGPAAAIIVDEPAGSTAAYLGVVSASFFASYAATRGGATKAQASMAGDFSIRGAVAGSLLADALNMSNSKETATSVFLIGLASTIAGYHIARPLTLAEVSAATFGSTAAGLTAWGIMAATGSTQEEDYSRNDAAAILAGGIAGLPLGLWYQRTSPHYISSGDVRAISVGGAIGALTGITIATRFRNVDERAAAAALTAGFLAGVAGGDLFLARPFDHTRPEGFILGLGTLAGALAGATPFVIADTDSPDKWLVGATLGAVLGAWGTTVLSAPAAGTARTALRIPSPDGTRLALHPLNAAFATTRVRGTFPLVSYSF
jgi:hypothetical protein